MPLFTDAMAQTDFLYVEGFKKGLQAGVEKCFEEGFNKGLKTGITVFTSVIKYWQGGMKPSKISRFVGIPIEEVELIIAEFHEFQKFEERA